jgi:hypothetical protein
MQEAILEGVTEGRMVHFVMADGEHRAAVIVNSWPTISNYVETGTVNLSVLLDGSNDHSKAGVAITADGMLGWATSVPYSETKEPRTWHWIEKA